VIIILYSPLKVRNSAINLMTKAIPPTMPIPNSTNLRWVI
jgi:hypothetical protein